MNRLYIVHDAKPDDCGVKRASSSIRIFSCSGSPISWCKMTMLPNLCYYFDLKTRMNYITCFIRKTSCFCLLLLYMSFFFPLFFPFFFFCQQFLLFSVQTPDLHPASVMIIHLWKKLIRLCIFFNIFDISC